MMYSEGLLTGLVLVISHIHKYQLGCTSETNIMSIMPQ